MIEHQSEQNRSVCADTEQTEESVDETRETQHEAFILYFAVTFGFNKKALKTLTQNPKAVSIRHEV